VDQNGIVTRTAGSSRKTGYSGDGGPGLDAELRTPSGIATDAAGDIFIAHASDYRVRKVSPDGLISTASGTGVQGYSGDGASATSAQLSRPTGLTTDTKRNLFIVGGVRGRKVSSSGTITRSQLDLIWTLRARPVGTERNGPTYEFSNLHRRGTRQDARNQAV